MPAGWNKWFWMAPRYRLFWGKEYHLPIDSHTAVALCAPRALLISEGLRDGFGYTAALEQSYLAAREVYRFLGAADKLAVAAHCGGHKVDWPAILDYMDWQFRGTEKKRDYSELKNRDPKRTFSWTTPKTSGDRGLAP